MNEPRRIGILTGGGDVPGLNVAIKAVTRRAAEHGIDVVGLRRGWGSLLKIAGRLGNVIKTLEHGGDAVTALRLVLSSVAKREEIINAVKNIGSAAGLFPAPGESELAINVVDLAGVGAEMSVYYGWGRVQVLQQHLVEVHRLENIGDDNNHAAVAELYESGSDPILVMKWKEIYDLTERAIDRCEDVANAIEGIVLKNT